MTLILLVGILLTPQTGNGSIAGRLTFADGTPVPGFQIMVAPVEPAGVSRQRSAVTDEAGNYRLTNLQAAVGCAQMERLDDHIAAKRRIAERYTAALGDLPGLSPMAEAPWAFSAYWMYTILVDEGRFGMSSRALLRRLERARIQSRPLWQPGHLSPSQRDVPRADCPVAERLNRDALSLPCSVGLTDADQDRVIETIRAAARGAEKREA